MTTYQDLALQTLSQEFHDDKIPQYMLELATRKVVESLKQLDGIKKTLFYGKPLNLNGILSDEFYDSAMNMKKLSPVLLHGIIGMATELSELLQVLMLQSKGHYTPEEFYLKLKDELGDVEWYKAITYSVLPFSLEEVQDANIRKLQKRYSNGFNATEAIHKNEAAELEVIKNV